MSQRSVAVVGVIYPEIEKFLNIYLKSLTEQTYKEFDLILVNDGFKETEGFFETYPLNFIFLSFTGSPSCIRFNLLNYLKKKKYKSIIFSDCDDFLTSNRIEVCLSLLLDNDIVVNDIDIICDKDLNQQKNYFSKRFKEGRLIQPEDLFSCNFMGLTNTATKKEVIDRCLPLLGAEVIAFDWLLWTHALRLGFKARFTNKTSTKYRIYDNNISGFPKKINKDIFFHELDVKLMHYNEVENFNPRYSDLKDTLLLTRQKCEDEDWLDKYIQALNIKMENFPVWWESIKDPEEVGII